MQNFHNSFAARDYLVEHLVDAEGVQFAGAKPIDSFADLCNEDSQLRLLIGRHNVACTSAVWQYSRQDDYAPPSFRNGCTVPFRSDDGLGDLRPVQCVGGEQR